MNRLNILLVLCLLVGANVASADVVTQSTNNAGTVATTTIQTPTSITTIRTVPGKSVITKDINGTRYELDSDNSVYQVFPDGARTSAMDGQHTLINGDIITVKDGKRIP